MTIGRAFGGSGGGEFCANGCGGVAVSGGRGTGATARHGFGTNGGGFVASNGDILVGGRTGVQRASRRRSRRSFTRLTSQAVASSVTRAHFGFIGVGVVAVSVVRGASATVSRGVGASGGRCGPSNFLFADANGGFAVDGRAGSQRVLRRRSLRSFTQLTSRAVASAAMRARLSSASSATARSITSATGHRSMRLIPIVCAVCSWTGAR